MWLGLVVQCSERIGSHSFAVELFFFVRGVRSGVGGAAGHLAEYEKSHDSQQFREVEEAKEVFSTTLHAHLMRNHAMHSLYDCIVGS